MNHELYYSGRLFSMKRCTFKWAYEGGKSPIFGVDLLEMYSDNDYCTEEFNNYLSDKKLLVTTIESALNDYKVDVVGDVVFSGNQNDIQYLLMDTYRNFDGLVSGFGNDRVALICGHYIRTGEYIENEFGVSQEIWKSIDTIEFATLVFGNYHNEPLIQSDINLMAYILKIFEKNTGEKLGLCLPSKEYNEPMKLIAIDDFFNENDIGGI